MGHGFRLKRSPIQPETVAHTLPIQVMTVCHRLPSQVTIAPQFLTARIMPTTTRATAAALANSGHVAAMVAAAAVHALAAQVRQPVTNPGIAAINAPILIAANPEATTASATPMARAGTLPCLNHSTSLPKSVATVPIVEPIFSKAGMPDPVSQPRNCVRTGMSCVPILILKSSKVFLRICICPPKVLAAACALPPNSVESSFRITFCAPMMLLCAIIVLICSFSVAEKVTPLLCNAVMTVSVSQYALSTWLELDCRS